MNRSSRREEALTSLAGNSVGRASSLPVLAASCRQWCYFGERHGAGMPREPAGKDACPTLNTYPGKAGGLPGRISCK